MTAPVTHTLRPARDSDRVAMASVHLESWLDAYQGILPGAVLAGQVPRALSKLWADAQWTDQDCVLIANGPIRPLGFIAVWDAEVPFLDNLHVSPEARGQGMGHALIAAAARQMHLQGRSSLHLWVFEANEAARRFYRELGGREGQRADRDVLGHKVPSVEISWSSLDGLTGADKG